MIGVCIKYFHENYGGMLQAFATVKMLESRGIDYELIRYKKKLTAESCFHLHRILDCVSRFYINKHIIIQIYLHVLSPFFYISRL